MNTRLLDFIENSFMSSLLKDPEVTDVSYNGVSFFYVHNEKGRLKADIKATTEEVIDFIRQVANLSERQFSYTIPTLDVSIGKYPSMRDSSIDDREEERRVLYVALTRAKKELIITRSNFESDFIDEDALYYLRTQYFLNVLPDGLVKEVRHKKQAIEVHRVYSSFSDEDIKELPEKYRIRISNVKPKTEQRIQNKNSTKIVINNESSEEKNPLIVEYMKTRKFGDAYPHEIKAAIVAEYIPKVYGYKKIGKKYGINPDVIKHWITFGL